VLCSAIGSMSQSHQPIAIAVLLSESDWAYVQETLYLLSVPGMRESIRFGMATPIEDGDRPRGLVSRADHTCHN